MSIQDEVNRNLRGITELITEYSTIATAIRPTLSEEDKQTVDRCFATLERIRKHYEDHEERRIMRGLKSSYPSDWSEDKAARDQANMTLNAIFQKAQKPS
jgi:hypothetical protein